MEEKALTDDEIKEVAIRYIRSSIKCQFYELKEEICKKNYIKIYGKIKHSSGKYCDYNCPKPLYLAIKKTIHTLREENRIAYEDWEENSIQSENETIIEYVPDNCVNNSVLPNEE